MRGWRVLVLLNQCRSKGNGPLVCKDNKWGCGILCEGYGRGDQIHSFEQGELPHILFLCWLHCCAEVALQRCHVKVELVLSRIDINTSESKTRNCGPTRLRACSSCMSHVKVKGPCICTTLMQLHLNVMTLTSESRYIYKALCQSPCTALIVFVRCLSLSFRLQCQRPATVSVVQCLPL